MTDERPMTRLSDDLPEDLVIGQAGSFIYMGMKKDDPHGPII